MQSPPSPAVQIIVSIIPIVGIVMGSAVIFFYLLWNHKQRMLMIEKGMLKKILDLEAFSLFAGLLLFGIGTSLTLFFYAKGVSYGVLSGLIPLSAGASLVIFFVIRRKLPRSCDDE